MKNVFYNLSPAVWLNSFDGFIMILNILLFENKEKKSKVG